VIVSLFSYHSPLLIKNQGTSTMEDFSDFDIVAPNKEQLKSIEQLAQKAYQLMGLIDTHEAALKAHKAELAELTHKLLPDAMTAAGTASFITTTGVKISIKEIVSGSLPKDESRRSEALRWLENNGGLSIIKGSIEAQFERGEDNAQKRNQTAEILNKLGIDFVENESVHPQTLAAFAREKLKNGEEVPLETLGLWAGRQAKVTVS
jgi:hypothetical protein